MSFLGVGAAFASSGGMTLLTNVPTERTRFHSGFAALVASAALAASACGGDNGADPESTQSRVSASVPGVMDNAMASLDVLASSETLASLGQSFDAFGRSFGFADDGTSGEGTFRLFRDGHDGDFFDEEMSGEDLAQFLAEHIFTEENYEGDGYYRLPIDMFCPPDLGGSPPAECVEQVEALELRIRAVLAGENGVDIAIVVGPDRVEPLIFELRPDSLAVVADLGAIRDVAVFLADLTGEVIEDLPDVLEGVVAATLTVHGDEHVSVEAAVRQAIAIEGDGISLALAARDPMFALEVNGPEQAVTASIDIGPFNLQGPWAEMNEESNASGAFELDWQGFSAEVTLQEGAKTLQVENISFGDDTSTISLDGHALLAIDLNPDSGRSFTMTLLPEDGELPTLGFDPEFDLSLAFGFQPLADAGDEVPEFLLDETYRFAVTGAQPTIQAVDPVGEFEGGIRVVSGELSLASSGGEEVVVTEGSCLVGGEPEEGDHPLIGAFAEGSCE
jgi:hypothetical protein